MAKLGSTIVYGILEATSYLSEDGTKLATKYAGKLSLSGTTLSLRNQEDSADLDTQDLGGAIDSHLTGGTGISYSSGTITSTHASSNGTDHTYIDQDLRTSANPTFSSNVRVGNKAICRKLDTNDSDSGKFYWLLGEWGSNEVNIFGRIEGQRTSGNDDIRLVDFGYSSSWDGPVDHYAAYIYYITNRNEHWGLVRVEYNGTEYLALYRDGSGYWDTATYFTGHIMNSPGLNFDDLFKNNIADADLTWIEEVSYDTDYVMKVSTLDVNGDISANNIGDETISTSDPSGGSDGDKWFKV